MIEQFVPLTEDTGRVFNVTLTIPGEVTPDEWRDSLRRFSMRVLRAGAAMVWRVELQRRKQPHLHALAYVPEGTCQQHRLFLPGGDWVECLPPHCQKHPHAHDRAVHSEAALVLFGGPPVPDEGWMRYLVGHQSKRKSSQLGWHGRQWGVVNRERFQPLPASVVEVFDREVPTLNRLRRRWLRSKLGKTRFARMHGQNGWSMVCSPEAVRKMCVWIVRQRHRLDDRGEKGRYLTRPPLVYKITRRSGATGGAAAAGRVPEAQGPSRLPVTPEALELAAKTGLPIASLEAELRRLGGIGVLPAYFALRDWIEANPSGESGEVR